MRMKKFVLVSLIMACLPFLAMAQATDDLYFVPKKKTEKKADSGATTVYAAPGSTVVIKDVKGNTRDVDEYNRRYTSRDNTFSMENDTLYIEEKPYNERGEWVNGFEGSQSDYEYAMRIVRFRNPRYAIPVSSPLYWEVMYTLPSWEWNVYDDGFYAYAFPTYSNRLWWDWRFDYTWGWRSPWYYSRWYGPNFWYGSYWGGWYPHHHHHHWHPGHHHHPHYAWGGVGGYWGGGHGWHGSSALRPGIHSGRYANSYRGGSGVSATSNRRTVATGNRTSSNKYRQAGRVVNAKDGSNSVRPQRSAVRGRTDATVNGKQSTTVRSNNVYTRPAQGKGSSYTRQSSTRSTVNKASSGSSYQRKSGAAERGTYRSNSSSRSSNSRSSYNSSSSRSSSSRSSYSSGSSSSRSSYSSGSSGSSRSSGGGRSGGGRR